MHVNDVLSAPGASGTGPLMLPAAGAPARITPAVASTPSPAKPVSDFGLGAALSSGNDPFSVEVIDGFAEAEDAYEELAYLYELVLADIRSLKELIRYTGPNALLNYQRPKGFDVDAELAAIDHERGNIERAGKQRVILGGDGRPTQVVGGK